MLLVSDHAQYTGVYRPLHSLNDSIASGESASCLSSLHNRRHDTIHDPTNRLHADYWQRTKQHPAATSEEGLTPSDLDRSEFRVSPLWWTFRDEVPTLSAGLKALIRVRKGLTTGAVERVEESHDSKQRQFKKLTADQIDRLVEGYLDGKTVYQLAAEFYIARQTVSDHLKRQGVPMRRQGIVEGDKAEVIRLRGEGWSYIRIGERFSVDSGTVWHFMRKVTDDLPL